jgi:hypothetical protein
MNYLVQCHDICKSFKTVQNKKDDVLEPTPTSS